VDTLDAIADATGDRPDCFASQDYGYSMNTPALLAEMGLLTAIDWPNDEAPFLFGKARRILMLPPAAEMEDTQMVAGLDYWARSGRAGTVLALPLHAWIGGAAHRFASLHRVLQHAEAGAFWQASPHAIAQAWRAAQASEVLLSRA
jgi:allantoinase